MRRVTVVGSGASGVHFALTLLRRGRSVRMLDLGRTGEPPVAAGEDFEGLRRALDDPASYFLGPSLEGFSIPGSEGEYYGIPAHRRYVIHALEGVRAVGFQPLLSEARGGLAQVWTAGVYPFSDAELRDFPFSYEDLRPFYEEVARRIGICGVRDDLAAFMPAHDGLLEPLRLDGHASHLLERYGRRREILNRRLGCYMGLSRIATLSEPRDDRPECGYLGRCLWGCPLGALYTPEATLAECRRYPGFEYIEDVRVVRFLFDAERRVTAVQIRSPRRDVPERMPVEVLALGAGTLSSTRIFLNSLWHGHGPAGSPGEEVVGLMDNRQVLVPFLTPCRIGRRYEPRSYQYHQLCLGLAGPEARDYVHGQITTLTTAQVHPIVQAMPADFRTSAFVFRNVRAALGLVNLNFADRRRSECRIRLERGPEGSPAFTVLYEPEAGESARIRRAVTRVRRGLRKLGAFVTPGGVHVRPMGASVHYAGTLPMSERTRPRTVSPQCRSHDFENLYVVDGSTFPFLPAKNITFTLMANAIRVAESAF